VVYPKSGSWTGRSVWFRGAGQGVTTRNGATAQGGAVPSAGRCDPAAGCGRQEARSRHPLRLPDPRCAGSLVRRSRAPHSKELQRCHVLQKPCNLPRSELTRKVRVKQHKIFLFIMTIT
ncbi:MAG: hypothetical protein ABI167_03715, partial [Nitrosospira sp.]